MFAPRERPLVVVEERLLALRRSLNTPVVSTAELASGPARAAIAVYAEGPARRFAVIVRALRDGATVVYELDGDEARDEDGWIVALDASLSFGESMGFLFDDEMLLDRRPETLRRGLACLHELLAPPDIGSDGPRIRPRSSTEAHIGSPDDMAEILLEDELDAVAMEPQPQTDDASDVTGPLEPISEEMPVAVASVASEAVSPAPPTAPPAVPLSKFRSAAPPPVAVAPSAPAPEVSQRSVATLGRVRPVRLRLDADAAPKPDPLVRLLADF